MKQAPENVFQTIKLYLLLQSSIVEPFIIKKTSCNVDYNYNVDYYLKDLSLCVNRH